MKYNRLNVLKLPLGSTTIFRWLWNFLQAFPTVSLTELVNSAVIHTFSPSLVSHRILEMMSSQKCSHRQHWVLLDHDTESACQTLGLTGATLSIQGCTTSSRLFDVRHRVKSETKWVDEWMYKVTIVKEHRKHHDVDWVFGFPDYRYIMWQNWARQWLFTIWSWQNIFSLRMNRVVSDQEDACACSKALQRGLSYCSSWSVLKFSPFACGMRNCKYRHELRPCV